MTLQHAVHDDEGPVFEWGDDQRAACDELYDLMATLPLAEQPWSSDLDRLADAIHDQTSEYLLSEAESRDALVAAINAFATSILPPNSQGRVINAAEAVNVVLDRDPNLVRVCDVTALTRQRRRHGSQFLFIAVAAVAWVGTVCYGVGWNTRVCSIPPVSPGAHISLPARKHGNLKTCGVILAHTPA